MFGAMVVVLASAALIPSVERVRRHDLPCQRDPLHFPLGEPALAATPLQCPDEGEVTPPARHQAGTLNRSGNRSVPTTSRRSRSASSARRRRISFRRPTGVSCKKVCSFTTYTTSVVSVDDESHVGSAAAR